MTHNVHISHNEQIITHNNNGHYQVIRPPGEYSHVTYVIKTLHFHGAGMRRKIERLQEGSMNYVRYLGKLTQSRSEQRALIWR